MTNKEKLRKIILESGLTEFASRDVCQRKTGLFYAVHQLREDGEIEVAREVRGEKNVRIVIYRVVELKIRASTDDTGDQDRVWNECWKDAYPEFFVMPEFLTTCARSVVSYTST